MSSRKFANELKEHVGVALSYDGTSVKIFKIYRLRDLGGDWTSIKKTQMDLWGAVLGVITSV